MNGRPVATTGPDPAPSRAYGWYVVFALMLCQVVASIDVRLPFIMVEALKRDLGLSDLQVGLITGPAFSLTYALCVIPIARLSDRHGRVRVIAASIVLWSGFTALAATTRGFGGFVATRIGMAASESALTPASHSLISAYLSSASRPRGLALYSVGTAFGATIAFVVGGHVGDRFGWQTAFLLAGGMGAALLVLVRLTVREPPGEALPDGRALPRGDIASLFRNAMIRNVVAGGTLLGFSFGALNGWGPAYVMRTFHLSASETGASYGAVAGLLAMTGILAGGFIGGWLSARDPRRGLRMLSVAFVIAAAAQVGALLATDYAMFLTLFAVTTLLSSFYLAPTFAAIQSAVDPGARSFASAVTLFCVNGLGVASGSAVVGLLSDLLSEWVAGASLKWALIGVTSLKLWSAAHYWQASRRLPDPVLQPARHVER